MKKLVLFFILISTAAVSQYFFDIIKPSRPELPVTLLPYQAIRVSDFGLHSAAAGLTWVKAVQNLFTKGTKNYLLLPDYLGVINNLDSRFSYPYAFGALVLPNFEFVDEAIKIGERGLREADPDWRIPYYLATTYHIYKHDRINAIKYFDIAAATINAPDPVKRVALNYGVAPNLLQQSKQIWISIYETSDDEIVRARAELYILHYEYIELLEKASAVYKQKFGKYPETLSQLVDAKILKEIPKNPFGFEYTIDSRGRAVLKIE